LFLQAGDRGQRTRGQGVVVGLFVVGLFWHS